MVFDSEKENRMNLIMSSVSKLDCIKFGTHGKLRLGEVSKELPHLCHKGNETRKEIERKECGGLTS